MHLISICRSQATREREEMSAHLHDLRHNADRVRSLLVLLLCLLDRLIRS